MKVTVLGGGTWGATLAVLLHENKNEVRVWEFDPAVVDKLSRLRTHPRLPHLVVPEGMEITNDLGEALDGSEAIVCAVPAAHLRTTSQAVAKAGYNNQLFVICSKGIEQGTHALLNEVAEQELGPGSSGRIGLLSGPSHAEEVSRRVPTAITAASSDLAVAEQIRDLFMGPTFRVYTQTDMLGVELAASLKNVIAIACGVADGLGFGDNSKAALVTRGLSELLRLGVAMGAKPETFFGLAGVGDLVVTCMSPHSRNWRFGSLMGQGNTPEQALEHVGMVVEGYYTVRAAVELAQSQGVDMPITQAVADVLFHGKSVRDMVPILMEREPKSEME